MEGLLSCESPGLSSFATMVSSELEHCLLVGYRAAKSAGLTNQDHVYGGALGFTRARRHKMLIEWYQSGNEEPLVAGVASLRNAGEDSVPRATTAACHDCRPRERGQVSLVHNGIGLVIEVNT